MTIEAYHAELDPDEQTICAHLGARIDAELPEAEARIWHRHPVWFLNENPIVGYSKLKAGIRLMFWSGASFETPGLVAGTGKFKDASIIYKTADEIDDTRLKAWLAEARTIQWDYKNVQKRKGRLERLV
ncbi:DUF1801 domain-containing protein [Yoonia litorea]|uniref:YdhG-like domain-containing protein n=1 Tax=Yoonia litorea TaxID=1123755 RepID=A0A1I6LZ57_9RHOB|nr:DUF1801 domain-containing protein [Yoonia litorea]SFS08695.1 protein of unknown function (DU1801) [Yoonia litorea]